MPERSIVARELADLLSTMAHPARVRIIEELGQGSKDVTELVSLTGLAQPTVSQHLGALRGRRLVRDERHGRSVRYSLSEPWLAEWLLDGLRLIDREGSAGKELMRAAKKARRIWKQS
ncbi:MAG: metalloregulator ArsR/SmtB family transcription factor [Pirellulales bacterium]